MIKNGTGQKLILLAMDSATSRPKTGDAVNLTAYVAIDNGSLTALGDTSATEMSATNAAGLYIWDLTQAESNGDQLLFTGKSSTSGVYLVPLLLYTVPVGFTDLMTVVNAIKAYADRTVLRGTVSATSPTISSFTCSALDVAGSTTDQFRGRIILFDKTTTTTGLRGQGTDILGSTVATLPLLTFSELTTAPVSGDSFSIV